MRSSKRNRSPQPGHANASKSTSLVLILPWKQITKHLINPSLTDLFKMPPGILRFRPREMLYNPVVLHVPGECQT